jgi:hypothetical protein
MPAQVLLAGWTNKDSVRGAARGVPDSSSKTVQGLRLLSLPLQFPVGEHLRVAVGGGGEEGEGVLPKHAAPVTEIVYRTATLRDLQLVVDPSRREVTLLTVWRAVGRRWQPLSQAAGAAAGDPSEEGATGAQAQPRGSEDEDIVFEGLVGKASIPWAALRSAFHAQDGDSSGEGEGGETSGRAGAQAGAGRGGGVLPGAPKLQLVAHSAAHERVRFCVEDAAVCAPLLDQIEQLVGGGQGTAAAAAAAVGSAATQAEEVVAALQESVKVGPFIAEFVVSKKIFDCLNSYNITSLPILQSLMLRRVFLVNRFSARAICGAYDSLHSSGHCQGRPVSSTLGSARKDASSAGQVQRQPHAFSGGVSVDKRTPAAQLPLLVMQLCEQEAWHRTAAAQDGYNMFAAASAHPHPAKQQERFVLHLYQVFCDFLRECEVSARRLEVVGAGSLTGWVGRDFGCVRHGDSTQSTEASEGDSGHYCVTALVAHAGGELCVVRSVPPTHSSTAASSSAQYESAHVQADAMLRLVCDCGSDGGDRSGDEQLLRAAELDLDTMMASYLNGDMGPIAAASLSWVSQYFVDLVPSLRHLVPALGGIVRPRDSDRARRCWDVLLELGSADVAGSGEQRWLAFASKAFKKVHGFSWGSSDEGDSGAAGGTSSSSSSSPHRSAPMLAQMALLVIRERISLCKRVLVLFHLLLDAGHALLSAESASLIRTYYIPQVAHKLLHYSLLAWMDTVRPTSNLMLRYDVELSGLFPLSNYMAGFGSGRQQRQHHSSKAPSSVLDQHSSVLSNALKSASTSSSAKGSVMDRALDFLSITAHPSVHSDLAVFLFQTGQYVCLARFAAMVGVACEYDSSAVADGVAQAVLQGALTPQVGGAAQTGFVPRLLPVLGRCKVRVAQLIAEYLELCRAQWYCMQTHQQRRPGVKVRPNAAAASGSSLVAAISLKISQLLAATQEIGELAASLVEEVADLGVAHTGANSIGSDAIAPQMSVVLQQLWAELAATISSPAYSAAARASCAMGPSQCAAARLQVEGLLAFADLMGKLTSSLASEDTSAALFASLVNFGSVGGERPSSAGDSAMQWWTQQPLQSSQGGMGRRRDADPAAAVQLTRGAIMEVFSAHPAQLCAVLQISAHLDVLELVDRTQALLPIADGAEAAVGGALGLVDLVTATLDALWQADSSPYSLALVGALHGAWSRVFEYAVLHGDRCNEALEALLHLAELEEQRALLRGIHSLPASPTKPGIPAPSPSPSSSVRAAHATVVRVPWRDCLRTLVAQACVAGKLGWLCSVPDRVLVVSPSPSSSDSDGGAGTGTGTGTGTGKASLSLSEAISSTLEVLANTLDLHRSPVEGAAGAGQQAPVNYFECLMVYHICRRKFQETARAAQSLLDRLSAAGHQSAWAGDSLPIGYVLCSLRLFFSSCT